MTHHRTRDKNTCFCSAFAVEHLQDIFGNLLDGVSGLVAQFAHAVEDDEPLVTLVAGILLLKWGRYGKM